MSWMSDLNQFTSDCKLQTKASSMKAIACTQYGSPDVLQLKEVEEPVPKEDEILIKIYTTAVTTGDTRIRGLNVPAGFGLPLRLAMGWGKPRNPILGIDFAGIIESVGSGVTQFKIGDKVFGSGGSGSYAEYLTIDEDKAITLIPSNLSYDEAAAVPFGALSSLIYLRDLGKIQSGQRILVNGASGCLGTYAVQLGKYFGAEVTGVCSTSNVEWVKALGADTVIDYTRENFTRKDVTYDIIFDTVGKITFSDCKAALKPKGRFLMAFAGAPQWLQVLSTSVVGSKKAVAGMAVFTKEDLNFVKDLIEEEKLKPVIDRKYALEQMAEAHRYVDEGHKKGNVLISVVDKIET